MKSALSDILQSYDFNSLSANAKYIFLFLSTSNRTNCLGVYRALPDISSLELSISIDLFLNGLNELSLLGFVHFSDITNEIYIPSSVNISSSPKLKSRLLFLFNQVKDDNIKHAIDSSFNISAVDNFNVKLR